MKEIQGKDAAAVKERISSEEEHRYEEDVVTNSNLLYSKSPSRSPSRSPSVERHLFKPGQMEEEEEGGGRLENLSKQLKAVVEEASLTASKVLKERGEDGAETHIHIHMELPESIKSKLARDSLGTANRKEGQRSRPTSPERVALNGTGRELPPHIHRHLPGHLHHAGPGNQIRGQGAYPIPGGGHPSEAILSPWTGEDELRSIHEELKALEGKRGQVVYEEEVMMRHEMHPTGHPFYPPFIVSQGAPYPQHQPSLPGGTGTGRHEEGLLDLALLKRGEGIVRGTDRRSPQRSNPTEQNANPRLDDRVTPLRAPTVRTPNANPRLDDYLDDIRRRGGSRWHGPYSEMHPIPSGYSHTGFPADGYGHTADLTGSPSMGGLRVPQYVNEMPASGLIVPPQSAILGLWNTNPQPSTPYLPTPFHPIPDIDPDFKPSGATPTSQVDWGSYLPGTTGTALSQSSLEPPRSFSSNAWATNRHSKKLK